MHQLLKRLSCIFTIFTTMKQFSLSLLASCTCLSCENCLCLHCSNLLLFNYLLFWFFNLLIPTCHFIRGRPFNSWGGGGWFWKKISCKRLLEEKNCMQHKWHRKKILALLQARKKNVAKLFHRGFTKSQQNCNHSVADFWWDSIFASGFV